MFKKISLAAILIFSFSITHAQNTSWWLYGISTGECQPSPFGEMHPKALQDYVIQKGGSIKVLFEDEQKGMYVFNMQLAGESTFSTQSFANSLKGCEALKENAKKSGV